ncbi:MAG: hypothetical protein ACYCUV_12025, partial [Phycisphaerae bacterium]
MLYHPVFAWDLSKGHTLADIGVTEPPSRVNWINTSYFGPAGDWWLGEFPATHLDLAIRLPGGATFKLRNAMVDFYGRGKTLGGMTIYSGPYSLVGGSQKVQDWISDWNFPRNDRRKLGMFMGGIERLIRHGQTPEINLYHRVPHGPSVAVTLGAGRVVGMGNCDISVSIFWLNALNAPGVMKLVHQLKD